MSRYLRLLGIAVVLAFAGAVLLHVMSRVGSQNDVPSKTSFVPISGPLKVSRENPRYFADPSGAVVYLVGSHNWNNLIDRRAKPPFNYSSYLDFLQSHNHNFVRLWTRENAATGVEDADRDNSPVRYQRTGPGVAADGQPKFDLTRLNPAYFERLRSRIQEAHDRGIYVMVMLFNGFGIQHKGGTRTNPWPGHPFNAANNINGIDGDVDRNGEGEEVHTLKNPAVTRLQEEYVKAVIDTVNDLDVLYEISNESHRGSTDWQYHMIRLIHEYERGKNKQNPVVMTYMFDKEGGNVVGANDALHASPADAVAPGRDDLSDYRANPPPATGSKVIFSDTDHLWGVGGDVEWVWKSFLRGHNPTFMDPIEDDQYESVRIAMGQTRAVASSIGLARMVPRPDLASSGYCLADPGVEYLIFASTDAQALDARLEAWMKSVPLLWRFANSARHLQVLLRRSVEVDLTHTSEPMSAAWFNTSTGRFEPGGQIASGRKTLFSAPTSGPLILHLRRIGRAEARD